jgi:2-polyprenyl-6-hydroxyphenyl methylase/3-demethylubiquinone-9 3-methyltransferase
VKNIYTLGDPDLGYHEATMTSSHPGHYYADHLSAERLRRCYDVAPPRVRQYLHAEIEFVVEHADSGGSVLELGCGYGRALRPMLGKVRSLTGVDISIDNLRMARNYTSGRREFHLAAMDAGRLAFADESFDTVFCIQNGIAVFGVDRQTVFAEAVRVTKPAGTVLFSSYSERFWRDRLAWFRIQAQHGLLGEIDEDATGSGVIVCRDGFRAETVGRDEFVRLAAGADQKVAITEVDDSSLFCVMTVS